MTRNSSVTPGFIVEGDNGLYLDAGYNWKKCDHQSDIHVHSNEDIGDILTSMKDLGCETLRLYPAQFFHDAPHESSVMLHSDNIIVVSVT